MPADCLAQAPPPGIPGHDNADVSAVPFGDLVKVRAACRLINDLKIVPALCAGAIRTRAYFAPSRLTERRVRADPVARPGDDQ